MHFASRLARATDDRPALLQEIASLRARVAELESLLLTVNAANTAANKQAVVNTPANSRTAYMRDYMRRRRAQNKNSPSV